MRKTGSAIASILRMNEADSAHERVLRTTFWISSPSRSSAGGELIALDAVRAQREQTRR
jgi:hypothetical protein